MDEKHIPKRPTLSHGIARIVRPLNSVFDFLYHSEYNPIYRSGTLAIGLTLVLIVTGVYLLFFYNLADPYSSVVAIQEQIWLGRWIRALHRYSTDAALIAIFFHVLQLLAQGKTWGPRTLAWVSGIILLFLFLISAWTGYVMVWDQQGQVFALAGASLLQSFPFLHDELGSAFSGQIEVPSSFFFMNLFLHVALPLGLMIGVWIHTARLARTVWFPIPSMFAGTVVGLTLLALVLPATLLSQADLLSLVGRIRVDLFLGFWLPLLDVAPASLILAGWFAFFAVAISIPWWCRPKETAPTSQVDIETCNGCTQCVRDCPYEAIRMTPHPNGKHLLAQVSPELCVSCAICTASCHDLAIGPPDRDGKAQLDRANALIEAIRQDSAAGLLSAKIVVVGCWHNDSVPEFLNELTLKNPNIIFFGLNCCGTLNSKTIELFLNYCRGALLVGCAARNCMNRDGLKLLSGRIFEKRVPFLSRDIDRKRIAICAHSEHEKADIQAALQRLEVDLQSEGTVITQVSSKRQRMVKVAKRCIGSAAFLGLIGLGSQTPLGTDSVQSRLRVVGKLPSYSDLRCRPLTDEERASRPLHMQQKEICDREFIRYVVTISLDGTQVHSSLLTPDNTNSVFFSADIIVEGGTHQYVVDLAATPPSFSKHYTRQETFLPGRVHLVHLDS